MLSHRHSHSGVNMVTKGTAATRSNVCLKETREVILSRIKESSDKEAYFIMDTIESCLIGRLVSVKNTFFWYIYFLQL